MTRAKYLSEYPEALALLDLEANNLTLEEAKGWKMSSKVKLIWNHVATNGDTHQWTTAAHGVCKRSGCLVRSCLQEKFENSLREKGCKLLSDFPEALELFDLNANNMTLEQAKDILSQSAKKYIWTHIASNGELHSWTTTVGTITRGCRCSHIFCKKEKEELARRLKGGKTLSDFPDVLQLINLQASNLTEEQAKDIAVGSGLKLTWVHTASDGDIHTWIARVVTVVEG